ncbi:transcriptional regulator FeaR [Pseudomonas sp.]|uniref:transcriptional regulator FeaR n=1 Tax=Pseudomonas sp. TaxID=306 RepID=UPI0028AD613C|nr:transcriptional regulator FeaR [Pseudomonas sp.]
MLANTEATRAFEDWRSQLRAVCGDFEVLPSRQHSLFIGDVGRQELDGLEIARIRTNVGLLSRHLRCPEVDDDRHCFLVFQRVGKQIVRQGDRSFELAPGDVALIDSATPFEIEPLGLIENISFHLSRDDVRRRMGARALCGKLSASSNASRMLSSLVQPIHNNDFQFQSMAGDGRALQEALIALMAPALTTGEQPAPRKEVLGEPQMLFSLALRLIENSLQDCSFDPYTLADRLGVSVRRLYRLFEMEGESVCRVVLRRRLQRSAEDLLASGVESITQVAFKWGFVDAAHFSRAFRRQFGLSPREYRLKGCAA